MSSCVVGRSILLWVKNESCLKSLSSSSQEYFPVAVSACFMLLCSQSVMSNFCSPMNGSTPGFPLLLYLPELAQTRVHWADDAIQPSRPLSPLPSVFASIRVFSCESALWPKYWSFSFSISPASEYSGFPLALTGLISWLSKELSRILTVLYI